MSHIAIVELLPFFFLEEMHKFFQNCQSFLIEERSINSLFDWRLFCSKKWNRFIKIDLIFEFIVVGFKVIEIFIEDDTDNDLIVLDGNSSK
jgi:hypothetical protein